MNSKLARTFRLACVVRSRWKLSSMFYSNSQTPPLSTLCWKCGNSVPMLEGEALFFCHCPQKIIMKPTTNNYFNVMSYSVSYDIDMAALKKKYKHLQAELHPDKFVSKTAEEKELSAEQSSLVNQAFSTLSDPYSRGLAILELHGETIDEKDNTAASDFDFLEEVMSLNEELQELQETRKLDRLLSIRDLSQTRLDEFEKRLRVEFENSDIQAAKETLSRMKYFVNIDGQVKDLIPLDYQ